MTIKLERGHIRIGLIRKLATGEHTVVALAREYSVLPTTISEFRNRHKAEIAEMRGRLDDDFAALWIASKAARLAEYQQSVDDVNALMELDMPPDEDTPTPPVERRRADPSLLRVKHAAIRAAAEELGQLPTRMDVQVTGDVVHYAIGVDAEVLEAMRKPDNAELSSS